MNIKLRGSEDFVIEHKGKTFIVDMDFAYPEQSREPRWFVHMRLDDGDGYYWDQIATFDPSEFNEALYFIDQLEV